MRSAWEELVDQYQRRLGALECECRSEKYCTIYVLGLRGMSKILCKAGQGRAGVAA